MDTIRDELEREITATEKASEDVRLQLGVIRAKVADEVDRTWTSPWKSPETVDAKVRARLAGHSQYQTLRARQRELDERRRTLAGQMQKGSGR